MGAERERVQSFGSLEQGLRDASPWYLFGSYLSERQWGTVREDYSADGEAWGYLSHDRARSQAYRWGLGLALWNGRAFSTMTGTGSWKCFMRRPTRRICWSR